MNLHPALRMLANRRVLLVGGGRVAASKLDELLEARARVRVVAPRIGRELERAGVALIRRRFEESDLEGCWFAVAAATPEVNREVAAAAEFRRIFAEVVGPSAARAGATGLRPLLRQAMELFLPHELGEWLAGAECLRGLWREHRVPMEERRPLVLQALEEMYR